MGFFRNQFYDTCIIIALLKCVYRLIMVSQVSDMAHGPFVHILLHFSSHCISSFSYSQYSLLFTLSLFCSLRPSFLLILLTLYPIPHVITPISFFTFSILFNFQLLYSTVLQLLHFKLFFLFYYFINFSNNLPHLYIPCFLNFPYITPLYANTWNTSIL